MIAAASPCGDTWVAGRPTPGEPPAVFANADAEPDELLGTTVGSFQLVKLLGRGGMGSVYLGEHSVIGSKVAVKFLHPHLAATPSLVQRFYSEAKAVNRIGHENIVSIIDMNVLPANRYYLVMEYLEGRPLSSLAKEPLEATEAIPILMQICDALAAAHGQGVVHRDLKPENVFLVRRGRTEHFVKLLDFGIAKLMDVDLRSPVTAVGLLIGTPEYMAPEQCAGEQVDGRADLYALGVISYLMSTGRLPFFGLNVPAMLLAHRDQTPEAPTKVNPQVPAAWSEVTMRLLAKRPSDRYADAQQLRESLAQALSRSSAKHSVPFEPVGLPPQVPTPQPLDSRHFASFAATTTTAQGKALGKLRCQDISRGGVFLCSDGPLPPVFSRVNLVLEPPGPALRLVAEVVRHVPADQARAWNMAPGFAVQFVDLDKNQRHELAMLVKGLPTSRNPTPPSIVGDDPEASKALLQLQKRLGGDHYALLQTAQDAVPSEIRAQARQLQRELEALNQRPLSEAQKAKVSAAMARLKEAVDTVGNLPRRLDYDANRKNFKGVARCLAAGLTVTVLEEARKRYLAEHPGAESTGLVQYTTATVYEASGGHEQARLALEAALTCDPLNLRFHQRYWALRKKEPSPRNAT